MCRILNADGFSLMYKKDVHINFRNNAKNKVLQFANSAVPEKSTKELVKVAWSSGDGLENCLA